MLDDGDHEHGIKDLVRDLSRSLVKFVNFDQD